MQIYQEKIVEAIRQENWREVESISRQWLARKRFFIPHLFLITALIKLQMFADADAEFETLLTYKFNLKDRIINFPVVEARYAVKLNSHFNRSVMTDIEISRIHGPKSGVVKWNVPHSLPTRTAFLQEADKNIFNTSEKIEKMSLDAARVTTFGSCFAANIATKLVGMGVNANNLLLEEAVNSTFANRVLLEVITDHDGGPQHFAMREAFGQDFLCGIAKTLEQATHIIITVGVAPSFFSVETDTYVFSRNYLRGLASGKIKMRTTKFSENVENLNLIFECLSQISPSAKIITTISPVPLDGTVELESVITADCVSKSVLRSAVHEVLSARSDIQYFPSFEVVRWLSGYATVNVFGDLDENSRHVSDWVVEYITEKFIDKFFFREAETINH